MNAKDNISPWLFYSIDKGSTWYRTSSDISEITFNNIQRSKDGVKNKLTIKVSDICGNVFESDFEIWGIEK